MASEKTLETLWEIAREVAEDGITIASDVVGDQYCMFCSGQQDYGDSNNYQHAPDCIVMKARALVKESANGKGQT
jgi:hypothetical protein